VVKIGRWLPPEPDQYSTPVHILNTVRREEPQLFDAQWAADVTHMIEEAVGGESQFAEDVLSGGVIGLTRIEMRQYLEYVADQRFSMLGLPQRYQTRNPFPFMQLQDVQELTNFFERRVSAYQVAVQGEICFDASF
jgi:ribonucleoside-diphosphate reductase beta chain